ncbi:MAG: hypothetical protein ACYCX8_10880 [Acidimicrobiales bacterium]
MPTKREGGGVVLVTVNATLSSGPSGWQDSGVTKSQVPVVKSPARRVAAPPT